MTGLPVVDWLISGLNVIIERFSLKPIEHNMIKGKPLSSQKGQAEAFFLIDDKGRWWVLKKFHSNSDLERGYLHKIARLLPGEQPFISGNRRRILSQYSLKKTRGYYFDKELSTWLDGTILMHRVDGLDWAGLADGIREGSTILEPSDRIRICRALASTTKILESKRCSHRDYSCGNIFINMETGIVSLIDYDSLYHPSLRIPRATTCGTMGYMSHLVWRNGKPDPKTTWCEHADRYALALLNTEFLMVEPGSRLTGDGGLFDQEELRLQGGTHLDRIILDMNTKYPGAAGLLKSAIQCGNFSKCPSPQEWISFCDKAQISPISAPKLEYPHKTFRQRIVGILGGQKCEASGPKAPSLHEMPVPKLRIPTVTKIKAKKVKLPPDPWS